MLLNRAQYPLYNTGSLPVKSVEKGEAFNAAALEVVRSVTFAGTPFKIENSEAIIGGVAKETNVEFHARILNSILGPNIASISGIIRTLKQEFPNIIDIEVVGSPDPLMTRDLSVLTDLAENFREEDFYLVYPDQQDFPLSKGHEAFYGEFIDLDETAQIKLPSPGGFTKEFTDIMYEGIMLKDDLRTAEAEVQAIASEFFNEETIISGNVMDTINMISGVWEIHDTRNPGGLLFYADEIRVENGYLAIGKYIDLESQDLQIPIPYTTLQYLQTLLVDAVTYDEGTDVELEDDYEEGGQ